MFSHSLIISLTFNFLYKSLCSSQLTVLLLAAWKKFLLPESNMSMLTLYTLKSKMLLLKNDFYFIWQIMKRQQKVIYWLEIVVECHNWSVLSSQSPRLSVNCYFHILAHAFPKFYLYLGNRFCTHSYTCMSIHLSAKPSSIQELYYTF